MQSKILVYESGMTERACNASDNLTHSRPIQATSLSVVLPIDELIEKADGFAGVFPGEC